MIFSLENLVIRSTDDARVMGSRVISSGILSRLRSKPLSPSKCIPKLLQSSGIQGYLGAMNVHYFDIIDYNPSNKFQTHHSFFSKCKQNKKRGIKKDFQVHNPPAPLRCSFYPPPKQKPKSSMVRFPDVSGQPGHQFGSLWPETLAGKRPRVGLQRGGFWEAAEKMAGFGNHVGIFFKLDWLGFMSSFFFFRARKFHPFFLALSE